MSFQTPGGPAAKRRRVETANATLRKPFRSPLISRQQNQNQSTSRVSTPTTSTPSAAEAAAAAARTPETPALGSSSSAAPNAAVFSRRSSSPPSLGRHADLEEVGGGATATRGENALPSLLSQQPRSSSSSSSRRRPFADNPPPAGPDESDPALLLLLRRIDASRGEMQAQARAMRAKLEVVRQARRIEQQERRRQQGVDSSSSAAAAGGSSGGGRGGGADLAELVAKWKGAIRVAAEELFELVKGRVEGMGGARAWRESRRAQIQFGGFGDGDGNRGGSGDGDGDGDDGGDVDEEPGRWDRAEDREELDAEEEDSEQEGFTMLMMLKSLNIDPDVLGYDPVEDKWRD